MKIFQIIKYFTSQVDQVIILSMCRHTPVCVCVCVNVRFWEGRGRIGSGLEVIQRGWGLVNNYRPTHIHAKAASAAAAAAAGYEYIANNLS